MITASKLISKHNILKYQITRTTTTTTNSLSINSIFNKYKYYSTSSSSSTSDNNNNDNDIVNNNTATTSTTETPKTKKIKIKIKSKDPFLLLSNNKKIYFKKPTTANKKQQQQHHHHPIDDQLIPTFNEHQIPQIDFQQSIIDTDFQYNNYNHGIDSFNNIPSSSSLSLEHHHQHHQHHHRSVEQLNFENNIQNIKYNISSSTSTSTNTTIVNSNNNNNINNNLYVNNNNNNNCNTTLNSINNNNNNNKSNIPNLPIRKKKHTVLIDGTLMAYKAYQSPVLTNGETKVTVIYGFLRSLLKVITELQPIDNLVVCFDSKRSSNFRKEIYPEYKSNRPPTPDDLIEQLNMIPEVTESLGIPFTMVEGYECDDLLATYSKQILQQYNLEKGDEDSEDDSDDKIPLVTIVTDDKDICQLVNKNVHSYSTRKGKGRVTEKDIIEKYGFEPNKFVTYQSLIGDSVDNIPGIPRLGPKNATEIIKQFGNLNSILENVDNLPLKFIEPVKQLTDQLKISYQLAKLNDNVPLKLQLNEIQFNPINRSKFYEFLDKYQFNSIKEQISKYKLKFQDNLDELESSSSSTTREYSKVEFNYIDEDNIIFEEMSNDEINQLKPKNVTMVRDVETAKKVVEILMKQKDRYHACDTEVIDIDLKKVSPIGHGKMICFSIYCGPNVKFHDGNSRVWVDVMDDINGSEILNVFKDYFEDESILKVWHNYAFDRHIFYNHGINVRGFGGDTLHMARLWNASRMNSGGYSLEALSKELLGKAKIPIKDLFGSKKIKANGEEGKSIVIPPLERIQRDRKTILNWIEYSSLDSELTWLLRENVQLKLRDMEWNQGTTMWDFYYLMWRPFGHLLTEMEQRGLKVDIDYLKSLEEKAYNDMEENRKIFINWAKTHSPGAEFMNPDSDAQIQQLLFAPVHNNKTKETLERSKEFETDNVDGFIEPGKTKPKKKKMFVLDGIGMTSKSLTTNGWPSVDSASLRELAGKSPENGKFGTAYQFFTVDNKDESLTVEQKEQMGKDASIAINALLELGSIGTLLNTFIIPLQKLADSNSRLHTSVNVNTETGRLSSKRPNLQNQPALEKDRYKIRKAFTCEPGNVLIVADYGQLELRLLAHITNCKSMINAFHVGGDFHSRTAMGMYPHVKEAVDRGEVLLEWDGDGEPPKPLLKNVYASERRKAKTLNFSIAYGKTAHGLSQDWGVSLKEAQETLNRWYEDRPEVLVWQRKTIATAHKHGWTRTLMGRYRQLPDIANNAKGMKGHAERASINTPLQGGAADIVMKAMLIIEDNKRLKELGYKLIMQIHDELILEGPEQFADEARSIMINLMSNPLTSPLLIDLVVDCRYAKTWYDAK